MKSKILNAQEDHDTLSAFFNIYTSEGLRLMARSLLDTYVLDQYNLVRYTDEKNSDILFSLKWIKEAHQRTEGYVGLQDAYHKSDLPWMEYVKKMQDAILDVLPEHYGHLDADIHKLIRYFDFDLLEQFYLFYVYDVEIDKEKDPNNPFPEAHTDTKTKDDLAYILKDATLATICRIGIDMVINELLESASIERISVLFSRVFEEFELKAGTALPPFLVEWRIAHEKGVIEKQNKVIIKMQGYIVEKKYSNTTIKGITHEQIERLKYCVAEDSSERKTLWVVLYSMVYTLTMLRRTGRDEGFEGFKTD